MNVWGNNIIEVTALIYIKLPKNTVQKLNEWKDRNIYRYIELELQIWR